MVLAQHSSAKQLIPRFRVYKEKFSNLSGVSMTVDENDSVVKNCWNINLKRTMQQKEQQALGLQLQPQECTYSLKQHALILGKPKKRGGGAVTWGSYQILMTSALNAFQTTVGGQGRSGTEGGRGEERRDHDVVKEKNVKRC